MTVGVILLSGYIRLAAAFDTFGSRKIGETAEIRGIW